MFVLAGAAFHVGDGAGGAGGTPARRRCVVASKSEEMQVVLEEDLHVGARGTNSGAAPLPER